MHRPALPVAGPVGLVALLAVGAGSARAEPSGAEAAGRAMAAGRFRDALALYREAARREPARAELRCGVGLAHERLGSLPQAHALLSRCLAAAATPPEGAAAALRRVTRALSHGDYAPIAIDVRPAGAELRIASFAGDEALVAPIDLWLPFGTHGFALAAAGHEEHRGELVVDSNSRQTIAVTLQPAGGRSRRPAPSVDFGDGSAGPAVDTPITAPDQRPLEHETLMPERFRGPRRGAARPSTPRRPDTAAGARRPATVPAGRAGPSAGVAPARRRAPAPRPPWAVFWPN